MRTVSGSSIHLEIGGEVEIDGLAVKPGDLLVGDNDGLIALSADELSPVLANAERIIEIEEECKAKMSEGLSFREVVELLPEFKTLGEAKQGDNVG